MSTLSRYDATQKEAPILENEVPISGFAKHGTLK